jgi:site-specific DNA recombinase
MTTSPVVRKLRCAVYTRKSSEEGLEQEFNSLHAQREACEAYVASQRSEGWVLVRDHYDDGGVSGGTLDRTALQRLLEDVEDGLIDVIVVYKIDRLSRSLADFAKLVEVFDRNQVTFVSVTQSFNTTTSMGRLTLNILLSFAQFEREVPASPSNIKGRPSSRGSANALAESIKTASRSCWKDSLRGMNLSVTITFLSKF